MWRIDHAKRKSMSFIAGIILISPICYSRILIKNVVPFISFTDFCMGPSSSLQSFVPLWKLTVGHKGTKYLIREKTNMAH